MPSHPLQLSRPRSLDELCEAAVNLQIAGRLDLAAGMYLEILRAQPLHAAANHCLGILLTHLKRPGDGLPHLLTALGESPLIPDYWLGCLEALLLIDKTEEAGNLLAAARGNGLQGAAFDEFARRLAAKHPPTVSTRAAEAPAAAPRVERAGEAQAAPPPMEPAAEAQAAPRPMERAGEARAAPPSMERVSEVPAGPPSMEHAAKARASPPPIERAAEARAAPPRIERAADARASRREKRRKPRREELRVEEMIRQSRYDEALPLARSLTQRHPKRGYSWKALGVLLAVKRDAEGALDAMYTAVELTPRDPEALRNLGVTLYEAGRYLEAESLLRRALEIDPNSAALHNDLGVTLSHQSRVEESLTEFRRAIALTADDPTPDSDLPRSSLLLGLSYDPTVDADTLFAEHCKVGRHIEGQCLSWPAHANDRDADRRLKVGLVSGDLWDHSVANFLEPVLARLRQLNGLELHAYDNNEIDDAVNARLRGHLPHWRKVLRLSDQQLARQIMDDGIDILVDLSGHTSRHRLRTFARKPAPVQVSWLGYPGTTGLKAMDYFLTDRHFLPPGKFDRYFTEKLVYLEAFAPFRPHERAPPVNRLPALETGCIRFGSFNRAAKINDAAIGLWSKLLRALPTASMLLAGLGQPDQQHRLTDGFAARGITGDRLIFQPRCSMDAYLALHHQVDLCLDTTPYTGGTTTCHALWMGVPTLTLAGPTPAARQSAAIQEVMGLEGFSAQSSADFVDRGMYWSENLGALAELRAGLRARCAQAPGRQPAAIVAGLECALRQMWRRWCANLPAESFEIPAPAFEN